MISRSGFAAFQSKEYRYFWMAAAFSNVGMWALIYGRLWLMHTLTDSPLMVGLVTTSSLGPVLLFSVFGGVVADRINRLKLLRATRFLFAIVTLLTGIMIATGIIQPWHLIAISVITGLLLSFDIPSRAAMLPKLVDRTHLASAIALYSFVFGAASILGPAIFAPLVNTWGIESIFFIIAGSYVLTVVTLCLMTVHIHDPGEESLGIFKELINGIRYTIHNRIVGGIILLGLIVGIFGSPFETLLPMYSDKIITGGIDTYGRLLLFSGIGGLIATTFIALLGTQVHPVRFLTISGIGFGLGIVILSHVTTLQIATITIALIGFFSVIFGTMSTTLIQSNTADNFRGRVMSINMLTWGATALGSLQMGTLGQTFGVSFTLSLSGFAVIGSTGIIAVYILRNMIIQRN